MLLRFYNTFCIFFLGTSLLGACQPTTSPNWQQPTRAYKTKNVVLVVIDGVRYSDAWGDTTFRNIPRMARLLAPQGFFHPRFYNDGVTYTNPGHVALTTGKYQRMLNNGRQLPKYPSVFHYFRKHTGVPASKAWVIASKDKLEILARTTSRDSAAAFAPMANCGIDGFGTGYRDDTTTFRIAKKLLSQHTPRLVLLNLREPDSEAHADNWNGYIAAIRQSDRLVHELWQWLQQHPYYQNNTTLLITNDHGRHIGKRFDEHGDGCEGCRHISLLALGPDVKKGIIATKKRSQADVAATIAELLGFPIRKRDGEPMLELFE
ncbi:MAG: sulfatase-like hydrolase/transferase [Rufibacter sp.]